MIVRAAPPDDDMDGSGHNAAAASRNRARSGSNASADQLQTSRKRSESGGGSGDGGGTKEAEEGKDGPAVPVCWFEDEVSGLALRWHLFAGTLYDLNSKRNNTQGRGLGSSGAALPWKLRVHFTSYPTNQILPFDTNSSSSSSSGGGGDIMPTIQRYYMNSLKQALFLQHGSTQVAMNICKADHRKLWDAVVSSNYHLYGEINAELQADIREGNNNSGSGGADDAGGDSAGSGRCDEGLRNIPVRVLVDSKPAIQRLCPQFCEHGESDNIGSDGKSAAASTLGDVLLLFCPNLFERKSCQGTKGAEEGKNDIKKQGEGLESSDKIIVPTENLTWVVQGIAGLPLTFPVGQIWRTLCSPDHFVYVSVVTR